MKFGICDLSLIPVRKEPDNTAEMVNQLLFGEAFSIAQEKGEWLKIKTLYDDYEGWIDHKQAQTIDESLLMSKEYKHAAVALDIVQSAALKNSSIPILIGSSLPVFDGMNFQLNKDKYVYNGQAIIAELMKPSADLVKKCALKYLNTPYLWGGRSPFGIDCSGFTQVVYKLVGLHLLRDANEQATMGSPVDLINSAKEGDLAFFDKNGRVTHVGIILSAENNGEHRIIHASGKVRIDKLDHYGIHSAESKKYTHKLHSIRRIL